jgi:hypothetical protein
MAILLGSEIRRLADAVSIDAFSATPQTLFVAPTSHDVVITSVVLRCTAAVGVATPAAAKVELNPAAGDLIAEESLIGVLVVDDLWRFTAESRGLVVPAGSTVDLTITAAATGTSQTLSADVFGYFIF